MIKFARPSVDKKVIFKIKKIIDKGVFVHGDFTEKFEKQLTKYFNTTKQH